MPDTARFYIEVDLQDLDRMEQLLNSNGVNFSQLDNMVCLPKQNLLDAIFTGADAQEAIDKINEHLTEDKHTQRLIPPFHSMTPIARRDLLDLITLCADWETDFSPSLIEIRQDSLDTFLQNHFRE